VRNCLDRYAVSAVKARMALLIPLLCVC